MAGVMGIDQSIFESATLDGASSNRLPQDHDAATQADLRLCLHHLDDRRHSALRCCSNLHADERGPQASAYTLMMYLYSLIADKKNYGQAGALSMLMFLVTAILSFTVYKTMHPKYNPKKTRSNPNGNAGKNMRGAPIRSPRWLSSPRRAC
jgi:cellobiose transport system permease protein